MKKFLVFLFSAVFLVTSLIGCSPRADYEIGIIQIIAHPALDDANQGFQEELTRLFQEVDKTVHFDSQDAAGESSNATTIANTMLGKNVDLILAIATPAAQAALAAATDSDIPLLFTAVTDPVQAGLVESFEVPNGNISGTSDMNPISQQVELIKLLVPGITKIGVLYNTSEDNSLVQVSILEEKCDEEGITLVKGGVNNNATEIQTVMQTILANVELIYLPTDNLIAANAEQIHGYNVEGNKIPIVGGEKGINDVCGIATYAIDYYELGKQTARMAFRVLYEKEDITKMPVEFQSGDPELTINETIAQELDFEIPQAVLDLLNSA
jgi:putative ABC transport system substrate-binding protein